MCHDICPINTKFNNNEDNICSCKYHFFYKDNDNSYICFDQENYCVSQGYSYTNMETKECFEKKEDCISKSYKILNDKC